MQIRCVAPWVMMRAGMVRMGTRLLWRDGWLVGDVMFLPDETGRLVSETGWLPTCPRWARLGAEPLWPTGWVLRDGQGTASERQAASWAEAAEPRGRRRPWLVVRDWASVMWPFARRDDVVALDGRVARLEQRLDAFEKRRAV